MAPVHVPPIAEKYPLEDIATLDELALELFDVEFSKI
jgi:hypothetical protein